MGDKGQQVDQKMKDNEEKLLEEVARQFGTLNAEKRRIADKEQHLTETEKRLADEKNELKRQQKGDKDHHQHEKDEYEDELETAGLLSEEEQCQIVKKDLSPAKVEKLEKEKENLEEELVVARLMLEKSQNEGMDLQQFKKESEGKIKSVHYRYLLVNIQISIEYIEHD